MPAIVGWIVVAVGLWRGTAGLTRETALIGHWMTPFAVVLLCAILGYGHFYAMIGFSAEYWALVLVTWFRPERLVNPRGGALVPLMAWLGLTAVLAEAGLRMLV